jgi:hypothetical protein
MAPLHSDGPAYGVDAKKKLKKYHSTTAAPSDNAAAGVQPVAPEAVFQTEATYLRVYTGSIRLQPALVASP